MGRTARPPRQPVRAQASLRKAQDPLCFTRLDADFDGVMTATYVEAGQV